MATRDELARAAQILRDPQLTLAERVALIWAQYSVRLDSSDQDKAIEELQALYDVAS